MSEQRLYLVTGLRRCGKVLFLDTKLNHYPLLGVIDKQIGLGYSTMAISTAMAGCFLKN